MEGMRKEGWMDGQKGVIWGERDGGNEEGRMDGRAEGSDVGREGWRE